MERSRLWEGVGAGPVMDSLVAMVARLVQRKRISNVYRRALK
jgi:hypothetical protein